MRTLTGDELTGHLQRIVAEGSGLDTAWDAAALPTDLGR